MTPIKPMFGREIYDIAMSDPEIASVFKGVLAYDQLNVIQNSGFPALFILNSDKASSSGEHWLLIFLTNEHFCVMFDSLALSFPVYRDLFTIINKKCRTIFTAPFRVQHFNSSSCGQHTLFFLFLLKLFTPQEIFKYIYEKHNFILNDNLASFYVELLKKNKKKTYY